MACQRCLAGRAPHAPHATSSAKSKMPTVVRTRYTRTAWQPARAFAGKRLKITQLGGHRTNGNRPPLRRPSSGYACGMSVCCFSCCRRDVSSSLVSPRRSHSYDDEDPTNGRQRLYPPYPSSASLDSASLGVPTPQSTVAIYGLRLRSQVNISILPNNFPVRLGYYPCGVVCLLGRVTGRDEPEPVPRERP